MRCRQWSDTQSLFCGVPYPNEALTIAGELEVRISSCADNGTEYRNRKGV